MDGYGQRQESFIKNEPLPSPQNELGAVGDERHPYGTIYQGAEFNLYGGSLDQFAHLPVSYNNLPYAETTSHYQNLFPPAQFDSQTHFPAYSSAGAQGLEIHAPNAFSEFAGQEQPWADEIHMTLTPVDNRLYDWAPPSSSSLGWMMGSSVNSAPVETPWYSQDLSEIPQFPPQNIRETDALMTHLHTPETTSRLPLQTAIPAQPTSMALKLRSEKIKKEFPTMQYSKVKQEYQPLRVAKTKKGQRMGDSVKQEACWRCKRYRKACIGHEICKECSTAGFRVWPSAIGCRRGAMEGFIEKIMPAHSIGVLRDLRAGISRTSNWRKALIPRDEMTLSPGDISTADRWDLVKIKMQSTMVFGADFWALVDIIEAYERAQKIEVAVWTQSVALLSSSCDFYHYFVAAASNEIQLPNLINATLKFRKSLLKSWLLFLKLCLSGRRENWLPAFLTVVLGICAMVIFMDSLPSVPNPTRKAIWEDVEALAKDLRIRQYRLSLDLLRIGAKGINPLKLDYWEMEEQLDEDGETVIIRNAKGMALLGHDTAAFDGFISLRKWHAKYKALMLEGNDMWDSEPYTLSHVYGLTALSKVFEF